MPAFRSRSSRPGATCLQKGLDRVAANYRATVSRGGLGADEMERRMALINGVTELDAVGRGRCRDRGGVRGDGPQKAGLRRSRPRGKARRGARHQHLDPRCRRDRAGDHGRPQDVLGTHFFSPANVMRLLEIVRGAATCARRARHRGRARPAARQGAGHRRGLLRLCRQPDAGAPLGRGRAAAARRRAAAGGRCRGHRVRVSDGAVRDGRYGRARCRLAHPQGTRRAQR